MQSSNMIQVHIYILSVDNITMDTKLMIQAFWPCRYTIIVNSDIKEYLQEYILPGVYLTLLIGL